MIADALKREVEAHVERTRADNPLFRMAHEGTLTAELLARYLSSIRFLLSQTSPMLARARRAAQAAGDLALAAHFADKLGEEDGHVHWAERDIEVLATRRAARFDGPTEPAIVALLDYLGAAIDAEPHVYLAYILWAEYFTVLAGAEFVRAVVERCGIPPQAITAVANHAELDKEHTSEGLEAIDRLVPDPRCSLDAFDDAKVDGLFDRFCEQVVASAWAGDGTLSASPSDAARLYGDWVVVERVVDRVEHDGVALERAGLTAQRSDGAVVSGSAASVGDDAEARARFELLERAAVLDAIAAGVPCRTVEGGTLPLERVFPLTGDPTRHRCSLSNGVALGPSLDFASERARLELVERDRVLRAWMGEIAPVTIPMTDVPATRSYRWRAAALRSTENGADAVVAVFGLPTQAEAPLLRGFAARTTEAEALRAALGEALQGLAFLWGEEIPTRAPELAPTPIFHLDYWLWPGSHDALTRWLDDGHARHFGGAVAPKVSAGTTFVDLTPASFTGAFSVVRAISEAVVPLGFGADPAFAHLPDLLRAHPIA